jgi:clan AA aspartic protease (TIGR02281 family)
MMKCVEETGEKDYTPIAFLADFYRQNGQMEEAIKWFSKLIGIEPTDAFGYYRLGWCYELNGNDEEAMKNYNMGIDIDGKYPYIYLMRGEQYLKRGDKEKANADFNEILKLDTVAEDGTCRMYALHFLGRDAEAIEWMDQVIVNDPDEKGNYYDQACLYARMGKSQESVAALRTAFEKGYRTFAHIEADDDMDAIREMPEFKALIKEYKAKPIRIEEEEVENTSSDLIASTSEVQMRKMRSGVYEVPCTINDLPLKFIFDTGASTTTISSVEAAFMLKNGYLKEGDIRGKEYYSTATGEIHEGTVIRLREIKIGDAVLRNVDASVTHSQQAPLLLGQSVMERFGTITIDNKTSKLTIKQK